MNTESRKKYVLTGGPGVGKTAVIEILASKGYAIVPEVARMIMEEEQIKNSDVLPWKNLAKFQEAVAKRQLAAETEIKADIVFLDRGIIDGYAYCIQGNIPAPSMLLKNAENRYDKVFLLAPLPEYENDSIRKEKKNFQTAIHGMIKEAYEKFGYELIHVPVLAPHERVEFIISGIRKKPLH